MENNPTVQPQSAVPGDVKRSPLKKILAIIIGLVIVVAGGFGAYTYFTNRAQTTPPTTSTNQESGTTGPTTKPVTLNYWGLWEPSEVLDQVFSEFESQHPGVTIEYTQQSPQDYRERLQSALARGDGPDIFRFHNTWVPMLSKELATLPPSIMSVEEFQSTFYPVASQNLRSGNSVVGIPLMIDGLGLYYNKSVFATAGKAPPTSWDELRQTASDLTIIENKTIERAGIAFGTTSNVDNFSDILALMLLQNGADPANPTNSLAEHAVTFYTLFSRTDNVWNDTLPPSTFAFATQRAAMMIAPSWRAHEVKDINPDLDFAIVPVPQLPSSNTTWASYWVEGVSAASDNQQVAWELINYLAQAETMRTMYTAASNQRAFGEIFSRVDLADQLVGDPLVGAYIQQAPQAQSWYMASRTFDNGINDRIIKYYEDAINSINDRTPITRALETAAQGVTQILSQYGVAAP